MQTRKARRFVPGTAVTAVSGLGLLAVVARMVADVVQPPHYTFTPPWTAHELRMLGLFVLSGAGTFIGVVIVRSSALKRLVVGATLVLGGLPVALVLAARVSLHFLNRTNGTVVSSGQTREYLIHVPKGYDAARPTPLVISLHALGLWPAAQMEISHWNRVADEHGFIVAYPAATLQVVLVRIWRLRPDADLNADLRFISDLIDELERKYNIDPARIYVNGFSNGGAMTFALSCTLSDRIAAVGTVSAANDWLPWSWCADTRPVPFITFHGTADPGVLYEGGLSRWSPRPFPGVRKWAADWARRNGCGPAPTEAAAAADVVRLEYTDCAQGASVVLYTVQGGGHSWPGGRPMPEWLAGPTSRSIDATREMWTFFREHPLRRRPPVAGAS
jgi:polyhydroxybutyrate depolymerase